MKKLTTFQLMSIMLCARFFSTMTYFPFAYENAAVYMLGALISTALQALILLPAAVFAHAFNGEDPCGLSASKSRVLGYAVSALYLAYFALSAFITVGDFSYFMDYYFTGYIPRIMAVVCSVLAAVYIARMKIGALGKTAVYASAGFIIMTAMVVCGSISDVYFTNFHFAEESVANSILSCVRAEFSRNGSLVLFVFLMSELEVSKGKKDMSVSRAAWYFLAVKIIVLELILFLITVILGDYVQVARLPFFSLAAYSQTGIIERFDGLFMFVWVIIAIVKLSAYIFCGAKCLRDLFPSLSRFTSAAAAGAVPAAASLFFLLPHRWERFAYSDNGAGQIVILTAAVPVLLMIICRNGGKDKNEKKLGG